jgi:hypothetical protein
MNELENVQILYGSRFPTKYLIEWANYLKAQVKKDVKNLEKFKEVKDFAQNVDSMISKITSLESKKERTKKQSPILTGQLEELLSQANKWRLSAIEGVVISNPFEPEVHRLFGRGVKTSSSLGKLVSEVQRILDLLKSGEYKKCLDFLTSIDKDFLKKGEELINQLKGKDEQQEGVIKELPQDTRELYISKGELYVSCRQVVRIVRLVFKSEGRGSKYNYDILNRAKRAVKAKKTKLAKKASKS